MEGGVGEDFREGLWLQDFGGCGEGEVVGVEVGVCGVWG